jgi:hypothetical protein
MKYLKRFDKLNETSIVRNNQEKWWEEKFDTEDDVDFIITKIKEKYPKEQVTDKADLIDMICWFEDQFKKDIVDEDEVIHQLGIEYGL